METDNKLPVETRRATRLLVKLALGFAFISALVSFLTAYGIYNNQQRRTTLEFRNRVLEVAALIAQQHNIEEFAQIESSDSPLYEGLKLQYQELLDSNPNIQRIYSMRKDEQGIYYVATAGLPGDESMNTFYSQRYERPPGTLTVNFDTFTGTIATSEIRTNQNGLSLTAYAPLLDSNGNRVGVVGVDVQEQDLLAPLGPFALAVLGVLLIAVAIGSGFGFVTGNALTEPIKKLTEGAQAFAAGDLNQQIEITTGDEVENLANTFNNMASDLKDLIGGLEERVAERTRDLETRSRELEVANERIQRRAAQFEALAQVTQNITSIRDLQELLPRITAVISDNFNFYHVGIFLLDSFSEYAVLVAANSEGGQRMLARKHRLRVGEEGIVGYAAFHGKPRIALDVGQDAVFFTNRDLPETHSEIALPLISKNIIVGVLDVQSTETAAFTNEDIQMLSLLADQVSLAIENARLFDDTRRALAESEMASRRATREAWERLPEQQRLLGFRYDITGAAPLKQPIPVNGSGADQAAEAESGQTVVPIELRGAAIGNLIIQASAGTTWDEDQLDLIRAVAERIALSAENARLFEETTARADRERLVSEITSKIRSHNDPQTMIQTAMDELRTALGVSRVEVVQQTVKGAEKSEA